MVGYHRGPRRTRRRSCPTAGFAPATSATLDDDGFLYITGRIKEQYKLENGKYVMPSPLEEELKLSPYVANVMIYGDGRPFNVALVVLDEAAVRELGGAAAASRSPSRSSRDPRVHALVAGELDARARGFKAFERPRAFAIVSEDFTTDNGLLTPTLKLKRRDVRVRYASRLDALYAVAAAPAPAPPAP